ncbi:LAQU0S10e01882g1_1 [Lachancea quebecensis]|uniref:LAQU0S10e01882g1_1 n=1 Tax=Lachancea quebecensis TaxID=1654605 RepID=A0A0P1KUC0_9SACH|nr:LAQU0S10e01882g1_1 [Lachancea quebecensis]
MSSSAPLADPRDGSFKRQASSFREVISHSHPVFKPAASRYWLYVSLACPWAHRALITRALKGLTSVIGVSVVHWHMDSKGWRFLPFESQETDNRNLCFGPSGGVKCLPHSKPTNGVTSESYRAGIDGTIDHNYHLSRLSELYYKADSNYGGRFTVPVLWDLETQTIVNNESSEIIRILNSGVFDEFADTDTPSINLVPQELEKEIDEVNEWVYDNINNGVYKTGFAGKQEVYEREAANVFAHLQKVENILEKKYAKLIENYGEKAAPSKFFIVGEQLTEADVRLYTTIVRFDPVYVQHFKCNISTIRDGFKMLDLWLRNIYWNFEPFSSTTNFDHIKLHYTRSHAQINPLGITPLGPKPDIGPL